MVGEEAEQKPEAKKNEDKRNSSIMDIQGALARA